MGMLKCQRHGDSEWSGHVACSNCIRVYQTNEASEPRYAPSVCECGEQLMPPSKGAPPSSYTAVPVCKSCFIMVTTAN